MAKRSCRSYSAIHFSSQTGLTLVEIIIVLLILSILMSFLVGHLTNDAGNIQWGINKMKLERIKNTLENYRLAHNSYPARLELLTDCKGHENSECAAMLKDDEIVDVWSAPIDYRLSDSSREYTLKSLGRDGRDGGSGPDRDLLVEGP